MKSLAFIGVLGAMFVGFGCGGDAAPAQTDDGPPLSGIWEPTEGDLFAFASGFDFRFLELNDDSTGTAFLEHSKTKSLFCLDLIYARLSDETLSIDLEAFATVSGILPQNFRYEVDDASLTLSDAAGRSQDFSRVEAVPETSRCSSFSEVTAYSGLGASPSYGTGLAYDGALLWFGGQGFFTDLFHSFDPSTGALVSPFPTRPSGFAEVHAYENSHFWFPGTTTSTIASRRDMNDVEDDTIDTDVDLSHKLFIDAMAWDGEFLWLAGQSDASRRRDFLKVDTATKLLLSENRFDIELNALTWDGGHFWAIVAQSASPIVKIDPATFQTVASYEIPGVDPYFHDYVGIAAVGEDLYILVREWVSDPTTAMIIRATP